MQMYLRRSIFDVVESVMHLSPSILWFIRGWVGRNVEVLRQAFGLHVLDRNCSNYVSKLGLASTNYNEDYLDRLLW